MQKIVLIITGCLCSLLSTAQFEKGVVTANFNVGDLKNISIANSSAYKKNYVSFNPGVGYFIKKNWEIGAGINYTSIRFNDHQPTGVAEHSNIVGINVYTHYYFGKGKLKPYLIFETGVNHSWGDYTIGGVKNNFNQNTWYTKVGAGLNWNVSKRVALFTEATYLKEKPFNRYGYGSFNLTVGMRFFFGKR
jgi:hypothetical protein